ncbi:MAG: LmbE family protein, partial [Paenibacillus macerans]|nr:LmbE family protein [Paenibacillus macerans]
AIGKATTAAFRRLGERGALYFISFGDAMERPEVFGYTRGDIVKVDVQNHLPAKLAAFRDHRCQSEIEAWVWQPDKEALKRLGRYEYFIRGNRRGASGSAAETAKADDLFVS